MEFHRLLEEILMKILQRGKSILLLGPRQTGKTTLIRHLQTNLKFQTSRFISLANLKERIRYEKDPSLLTSELEYWAKNFEKKTTKKSAKELPLVIIDEIQKLPLLLDAVQDLVDQQLIQCILTGSSARKLRRGSEDVNLLPGRVIPLRMDPLTGTEIPESVSLESLLLEGSLPEILQQDSVEDKEMLLEAYVLTYLEEEIRAEALVRDLGLFARFLEFASSESGCITHYTKISQELGVSHATVVGYYQILEDCLVAERIEPLTKSSVRKKLSKAQKFLFYDMGVRRIAAREGRGPTRERWGQLFEQFIGLELIRQIRLMRKRYRVMYWLDPSGPEVDWVIDAEERYIPIEVKWTDRPSSADARHLQIFLKEYPNASHGFVICNTPHPYQLSEKVTALPWRQLGECFKVI